MHHRRLRGAVGSGDDGTVKKIYPSCILAGLGILVIIVASLYYIQGPGPGGSGEEHRTMPLTTPGVSLMNAPAIIWPDGIEVGAGGTAEDKITLNTKNNGPGMVRYEVLSRVDGVYSTVDLPWPEEIEFDIEPSAFMALPNDNFTSTLSVRASSGLPEGDYVFMVHSVFEGVEEGWGWLTVTIGNPRKESS